MSICRVCTLCVHFVYSMYTKCTYSCFYKSYVLCIANQLCKNSFKIKQIWQKQEISVFWLLFLFEQCFLDINCTVGQPAYFPSRCSTFVKENVFMDWAAGLSMWTASIKNLPNPICQCQAAYSTIDACFKHLVHLVLTVRYLIPSSSTPHLTNLGRAHSLLQLSAGGGQNQVAAAEWSNTTVC